MYTVTIVWDAGANVKAGANIGGSAYYTFQKNDTFQASSIVPDSLDPNNPMKKWALIADGQWKGKYVAVLYPSVSGKIERATWEEIVVTPPPAERKVVGCTIVEHYDDGTSGDPIEMVLKTS